MSLYNSKNFSFTCLHSVFTCIQQISCHIHDSVQTITALALPIPVLKYTSKEGLDLLRLLTINGALLRKKCVLQDLGLPCATLYMRPCM